MTVSTIQSSISQHEAPTKGEEPYNAEVVGVRDVHENLRILRVRMDVETVEFLPGQYTVLGLGSWEPGRGTEGGSPDRVNCPPTLIKRAYSFSCPMLDSNGVVARPSQFPFLEFYFNSVPHRSENHFSLTPRLFRLEVGSRIFVGPRAHGHYTLRAVHEQDDVIFVSTGTGEAPHNAMIAELLATGHPGRIIAVTCARHRSDLGYWDAHRRLVTQHPGYRYLTLTTREPQNVDPHRADYVGKQYVQQFFASGEIDRQLGFELRPDRTQIFLCGSPAMIGIPRVDGDGHVAYPEPPGMIETLSRRGFSPDHPDASGNIHFEKYW